LRFSSSLAWLLIFCCILDLWGIGTSDLMYPVSIGLCWPVLAKKRPDLLAAEWSGVQAPYSFAAMVGGAYRLAGGTQHWKADTITDSAVSWAGLHRGYFCLHL
jgi:hypothetical protein